MEFESATLEELLEAQRNAKLRLSTFESLPSNVSHLYKDEITKIFNYVYSISVYIGKNHPKLDNQPKEDQAVVLKLKAKIESQANHILTMNKAFEDKNINKLTDEQMKQKRKLIKAKDNQIALIMKDIIEEKFSSKDAHDIYQESILTYNDSLKSQ